MRLRLAVVDPFEGFRWTYGVLVVTFKALHESSATAQMAVGPNGSAQYKITPTDSDSRVASAIYTVF